jgi:hypothetical protein
MRARGPVCARDVQGYSADSVAVCSRGLTGSEAQAEHPSPRSLPVPVSLNSPALSPTRMPLLGQVGRASATTATGMALPGRRGPRRHVSGFGLAGRGDELGPRLGVSESGSGRAQWHWAWQPTAALASRRPEALDGLRGLGGPLPVPVPVPGPGRPPHAASAP